MAFCGVMWNLGSLLTFGPVLRMPEVKGGTTGTSGKKWGEIGGTRFTLFGHMKVTFRHYHSEKGKEKRLT
jgi:hypothetical protein